MEAADGNRVFVADLSAERARLGAANLTCFGGRSAADRGLEGKMIGGVASSAGVRKGLSTGEAHPSAGAGWNSSGRESPTPIRSSPFIESGFSDQRLHGCNVLVDPIRSLVSRLEIWPTSLSAALSFVPARRKAIRDALTSMDDACR
jgi:hypothetical protein